MAIEVVVPEVGEVGMDVTFVRWLKAEGEMVNEGEPLFEVDTAKSVVEVQAFAAGRLTALDAVEGDIVAPHQVIASLLEAGEPETAQQALAAPSVDARPSPDPPPAESADSAELPTSESGSAAAAGASPKAKRLARERGIDLATIRGTGPGGLIVERDLEPAAPSDIAAPSAIEAAAPSGSPERSIRARQAAAARTLESWRTIPHFYLRLVTDVTEVLEIGRPNTVLACAAARALARHPECNLEWSGTDLRQRDRVDLGVLVDTPDGLQLPIVAHADRLGLDEIGSALAAAAERARGGRLTADDLGNRSLTLSNLGMFAVDGFAGVIAPPDVLLLAAGRVRTQPMWVDGGVQPRRIVELTLSVDHRALDGAAAARFLTTLEEVLGSPGALTAVR